jgi:hypothetical protein
MTFQMTMTPPSTASPWTLDHACPDQGGDEDFMSRVIDACALLGQTDCRFHVAGFGQDPWPVDVCYDLSTVVEQLPAALTALRHGQAAEIDFYGQGIERLFGFAPVDAAGTVVVRCASRLPGWVPDPAVEAVPHDELERMLTRLAHDFTRSLGRICPALASHEPFVHW